MAATIVTSIGDPGPGGTTRVILVAGTLNDEDTARLRTVLVDAIWRERAGQIVVELSHGVVMDDTAVGALVAAVGVAADQRVDLSVRCADSKLAGTLADAGLRTPLSTVD